MPLAGESHPLRQLTTDLAALFKKTSGTRRSECYNAGMMALRTLLLVPYLAALSLSVAQNKHFGVGFVPFMAGGDEVEQRIFRAVGELTEVDEIFAIENPDHMLETLGKLRRQGRKLDFLVIAGHGSKNDPSVGFAQTELLPKHVDLKRAQDELARAKAILARPGLTTAQKVAAQKQVDELQKPVNLLEQVPGVMKPGALVLLLNCSPIASQNGIRMVNDLGKLLLGVGGGRIIASKADVSFLEVEDLWDQAAHYFKNGGVKAWGDSFIGADWQVGTVPAGIIKEKALPKVPAKTTSPPVTRKSTAPATTGVFKLVDTIVGEVPGPGEANDHRVWGSVSETNWTVNILMKAPYEGRAELEHTYKKGQLGASLKVGDIIELQVVSVASKSGSYQPNLGGNAWWSVEGPVEVLETVKTFAGTASDGKFYAANSGRTKFKVGSGSKGQRIKIIGHQAGPAWGSSKNWNPVTYIYEFSPR